MVDGSSGSSWRIAPAVKYSSSKPKVGESGRMMGSERVKDHRDLSRGSSKETFFLVGLVLPARLDFRDREQVGVVMPVSGVHARDETDSEGECKLGSQEAAEPDLDRRIAESSAARMSAAARS